MTLTHTEFALLWYAIGLVGCAFIWHSDYRDNWLRWLKNPQHWDMPSASPTPKAILLSLIGALGGVVIFIVGIASQVITIHTLGEFKRSQGQKPFWSTPIGEWFR